MELLIAYFEKFFDLKLEEPWEQSGEIQHKDFRIKYIFTKDASGKTVLDLLIFEGDGFPPVHKRINEQGEIQELEKFGFSLIYETSEEKQQQEIKLKSINREIANLIIEKGLAEPDEEWIQKYKTVT